MSAEKRNRRTLSGKLLPADTPRLPSWLEIVAPQKRVDPTPRTGEFYQRTFAEPTVVVNPVPDNYRGGRARRPHNVFTTRLHRYFGEVSFRRSEAAHPVRRAQRNALRQWRQMRAVEKAQLPQDP